VKYFSHFTLNILYRIGGDYAGRSIMSVGIKARYLVLAFVPYLILYFLLQSLITVNQYNLLTFIDTQIPFIPQFVWIYHTLIPVIIATGLVFFKRKELFLSMVYANLAAGAILCLFYVLFPSFYPREQFVDHHSLSGILVNLTRLVDSAHNTFPSGHVTFSWLLALFVGLSQKGKQCSLIKGAYYVWALLIAVSTLTLKQHYLIDVISGMTLAFILFYTFKYIDFNPQSLDFQKKL